MGKPSLESLSNEQLVEYYQASSDKEAVSLLVQRNYHLIYGACIKILGSQDDAKDVCLDICESLFQKLNSGKIEKFNKWLFSVCNNRSISFIRSKEVRRKHEANSQSTIMPTDNYVEKAMHEGLSVDPTQSDPVDRLEELLNKLPPKQKTCLQMFYFKRMSYSDIAKETRQEVKQVKSYLQNGKRKLKLLYQNETRE
ncbi:MAG: sigma-70 family RNA polymerase sigma factor [Saprospiraceae bacterium]|nr:sigma-70 family RNA polymerase sigma factor [Saprospiraceae bacterium]